MDFKKNLAKIISKNINLSEDEIYNLIEIPPISNKGDFSFPCFKISKILKKQPNILAKELSEKIQNLDFVENVKAEGGYLNFFINKLLFIKNTLEEVLEKKERYGSINIGKNKNIIIDFSSPNIAKPFHVGHLRSTVIGNALYNIFNTLGYKSIGINHLGDWGTQFGKLIVAYKMWGDKKEIEEKGVEELNKIYVKFHEEAEKDNTLNEEARYWFLKMEENDKEALKLWQWFYDISLEEFNKVYKRLNIKFDSYKGESFYNNKMDKPIRELEEKKLLIESDGAKIVNLDKFNMPPCLILRKDGGTLYSTRDIAAILYRKNKYNFEKCIYVTALDQKLHFNQLFKVIELMGYTWVNNLVHVPFGLVKLETGKLSTRKGNVVLMNKLLDESVIKIKNIIKEKNPNIKNKDKICEEIGISAIIFNDLYNSRIKDVVFSWEKMLNFDGETGPYLQYTYVRTNSILKKNNNINFSNIDYSILLDEYEIELIKLIYDYKYKIIESAKKYEPFILTRHLINIAQSFNKFYNNKKIIISCNKTKNSRIILVYIVKTVLSNGLKILGISLPEEM